MNGTTLRRLRQIHQYLGMFFAPAILFFAFTGVLQTFSLHENHGGGPYKPPGWIVAIASLHKDQVLPRPGPSDAHHSAKSGDDDHAQPEAPEPPRPSPLPLKIFVLCLAIGLIFSTGLGVFIGLSNRAFRRASLIALFLGILLPAALIFV